MNVEVVCFSCKKKLLFVEAIGRTSECQHCGNDVRVCKNCQFYSANAYNECTEPQSERILEKERSNYCDFFKARSLSAAAVDKSTDLRAAAEALFRKK